jgi:hypothetical protein
MMQPRFWQGVLAAVGMTLVASAANATSICTAPTGEINPGTAITGVSGPICNGSTSSPSATGSSVTSIFLGFSASNTDLLSVDLSGTVFNNQTTAAGTTTNVTVTPGTLSLKLNDSSTSTTYTSGVGVANSDGSGTAYHFADFTFANAAAYDAFVPFDSITGNLTTAEINTINADGGFTAWTFIGAEDLATASNDDWNDLIFAISPTATPIPATLPLFAGGLGALGLLGKRRKRKTSSAIAAA